MLERAQVALLEIASTLTYSLVEDKLSTQFHITLYTIIVNLNLIATFQNHLLRYIGQHVLRHTIWSIGMKNQ